MNKYIKLLVDSYFNDYKILNLHEIPILHKNINETHISNIPEAKNTKPTDETLEYVINNSILDIHHIEDSYYYNALNIAISIIAYWDKSKLTKDEYNNIITLFNNCGYYQLNIKFDN